MKITNNFSPQFDPQKDIVKNGDSNKNIVNNDSDKDSFVKQDVKKNDEKEFSLLGKLKEKAFGMLSKPLYSNYPEITEDKKQKILDSLQPGDIILETNANYPFWLFMEKLAGDSDYSHAAIYEGNDIMIESTSDDNNIGVIRTDLKEYLHGRMAIKIIRPDYKSEEDIKATLDSARSKIGTPYDASFDYAGDETLFCSELVAKSLKAMPSQMKLNTQNIMGREMILPGDFQKLENSKIVYDDNYSALVGLKTLSPALIGGVAMAVGAGALLGPVGAVVGLIGGTLATSFIGGKIQENQLDGKK